MLVPQVGELGSGLEPVADCDPSQLLVVASRSFSDAGTVGALAAVFLESFADGRLADAELLSNFSLGQALLAKGLNLSHYSG